MDDANQLLRECRDQFRRYETIHRAKGDGTDTQAKAQVNADFAERIDRFLDGPTEHPTLDLGVADLAPANAADGPAIVGDRTARDVMKDMLNLRPLAEMSLKRGADHMAQLIGFHSTYNVPMAPLGNEDPRFPHMDDARVALRVNLIVEEMAELLSEGFGIGTVNDPICDITAEQVGAGRRNGVEVADALGDIVYLCYGMALEMGYDLRDVLAEIHASNLTKLDENGEPLKRADGKVLKGPNYMPPNIARTLDLRL